MRLAAVVLLLAAGCQSGGGAKQASASLEEPPYPADPGKGWTLTRNEEFSGSSLDTGSFSPCNPWSSAISDEACGNSYNKGREHFSPSAVVVGDGVAKLVASPMNPGVESKACYSVTQSPTATCDYRAGQLQGSPAPGLKGPFPRSASDYPWAFTHGYVEVRWKLPADAPGFFPAFWMVDTDGLKADDPAQRNYDFRWEVDMEVPGTPAWPDKGDDFSPVWMASPVYMSYYFHDRVANPTGGRDDSYRVNYDNTEAGKGFPKLDPRMNGNCPGGDFDYSQDWHTFAIDWGPTYMRWWIDRQLCGSYDDPTGATLPGPTTQMYPKIWIGVDQKWNRSLSARLDSSCVTDPSLVPCNLTGNSGAVRSVLVDYVRLWQQR